MSELRERKPAATKKRVPATKLEDYDDDKKGRGRFTSDSTPDLEPNFWVVLGLFAAFATLLGSLFYYKVDNRTNGPFAQYINNRFPVIDRTLNNYNLKPSKALFGAAAAETTGQIQLTEEELKAFAGGDSDKPIYLAINGTIFDVSASPAFYGPGGHYNHFVGKDATRAWITECWDDPSQFTWRLDDVEVMFTARYMDELLEDVAAGTFEGDLGGIGAMPQEMITNMAQKSIEVFGKVTKKTKAKRREEDKVEALAKVQETLAHWVGFFENNEKYRVVGTVIRDETKPEPPAPCAKAMEKRPLKGGKLDSMMGSMGGVMGSTMKKDGGKDGAKAGEIPAVVQEQIEKAKAQMAEKRASEAEEEEPEPVKVIADEDDLTHEEL